MNAVEELRTQVMNRYRQLVNQEHPEVTDWPIASGCDAIGARCGSALFLHLKDTMVGGISKTSGMLTLDKAVTGVDRVDRHNRGAVLERLEGHFRPAPRDALFLLEDVIDSAGKLNIPLALLDEQLRAVMSRHEIVLGLVPTKIFLSHKTADKARVMGYYNTLKLLGFDPWIDKEEMPAGTNVHRGIHKGFQDGCAVVFFITPRFKDEAYISAEIEYAMAQKTKRGDKFAIITLVLEDGAHEGKVPEMLKDRFIYRIPLQILCDPREIHAAFASCSGKSRCRTRMEADIS